MKIVIRKTNYKRCAKNQLWKIAKGTMLSAQKIKIKKVINPIYGTKLSAIFANLSVTFVGSFTISWKEF